MVKPAILRRPDFWTGWVLVALGGGLMAASFDIRITEDGLIGPRFVPQAICALIMAGGLTLSLQTGRPILGEAGPRWPWRAALLVAIGLVYVWLVPRMGYEAATIVAAGASLALFGQKDWRVLIGGALAVGLVFHLLFIDLMGVFMPAGRWFDLARMIG